MTKAIVIANANDRSVLVKAGDSIIYRVKNTDKYIRVSNNTNLIASSNPLLNTVNPASYSQWQQCGVYAFEYGTWMATLSNKASVYYQGNSSQAPASFQAYNMSGTLTFMTYYWINLSQLSAPGVSQMFTSGYVQASGTLQQCIAGTCRTADTYTSYLIVNTSGTYCQ